MTGMKELLADLEAFNESHRVIMAAAEAALLMPQEHVDQFREMASHAAQHDPDALTSKRRVIMANAWAEFKAAIEHGRNP